MLKDSSLSSMKVVMSEDIGEVKIEFLQSWCADKSIGCSPVDLKIVQKSWQVRCTKAFTVRSYD